MATTSALSPKQREIAERESRIRAVARHMVIRDGYHGLRMDRIAQQLDYSKGTIYNHFSCKEEIIIALVIESMEFRIGLFERAAAFQGRPRERMLAIGSAAELFYRLSTDHFHVEQIIHSASVWEKTSEKRRRALQTCEHRCMGMLAGIVRDGIAHRDLVLPREVTPEDLVFALWSLTNGAYLLMSRSESLSDLGIASPHRALRLNQHHVLDGYGWRPLWKDFDEQAVMQRIENEVFADEFRRLRAIHADAEFLTSENPNA